MILSRDELRELTGYRRPSSILTSLKTNRIPVLLIGADGWPRVLRSALETRPKSLTISEPNINALKEMQNGTRKNKAKRST